MEIKNPIVIIIIAIISIVLIFIKFNKKSQYKNGKKVANTKYIKETKYYKNKYMKYKFLCVTLNVLSALSIIITAVLVARPISIETKENEKFNRDVIMCIDTSVSQCEVNLDIVRKFRNILSDIKGDRIGIVIFNTCPVVYCPLTEDYEYINDCLNSIEKQMKLVSDNGGDIPRNLSDEENAETRKFWFGGTVYNSAVKGSSLVADGLMGAIYSFPDLKTDKTRTRVIMFATDNAVEGEETFSLEDTCDILNAYNISLYAYCPTEAMNKYAKSNVTSKYKSAVEKHAKGKFYMGDLDVAVTDMINEIKNTKATLLKTDKNVRVVDHPEVFLVITVVLNIIIVIIEKRLKI